MHATMHAILPLTKRAHGFLKHERLWQHLRTYLGNRDFRGPLIGTRSSHDAICKLGYQTDLMQFMQSPVGYHIERTGGV